MGAQGDRGELALSEYDEQNQKKKGGGLMGALTGPREDKYSKKNGFAKLVLPLQGDVNGEQATGTVTLLLKIQDKGKQGGRAAGLTSLEVINTGGAVVDPAEDGLRQDDDDDCATSGGLPPADAPDRDFVIRAELLCAMMDTDGDGTVSRSELKHALRFLPDVREALLGEKSLERAANDEEKASQANAVAAIPVDGVVDDDASLDDDDDDDDDEEGLKALLKNSTAGGDSLEARRAKAASHAKSMKRRRKEKKKGTEDKSVRKLLKALDEDGDGTISVDELAAFLKMVAMRAQETTKNAKKLELEQTKQAAAAAAEAAEAAAEDAGPSRPTTARSRGRARRDRRAVRRVAARGERGGFGPTRAAAAAGRRRRRRRLVCAQPDGGRGRRALHAARRRRARARRAARRAVARRGPAGTVRARVGEDEVTAAMAMRRAARDDDDDDEEELGAIPPVGGGGGTAAASAEKGRPPGRGEERVGWIEWWTRATRSCTGRVTNRPTRASSRPPRPRSPRACTRARGQPASSAAAVRRANSSRAAATTTSDVAPSLAAQSLDDDDDELPAGAHPVAEIIRRRQASFQSQQERPKLFSENGACGRRPKAPGAVVNCAWARSVSSMSRGRRVGARRRRVVGGLAAARWPCRRRPGRRRRRHGGSGRDQAHV